MKIVFMGTPEFAVPSLDMLVREGYDVAAVVTQPDKPKGRGNRMAVPPVKEYAVEIGIPVLQPAKVKTPGFAAELRDIAPDLLVTAAYGKILPGEVLSIPPLGCINVHGSLLPKYRGAAPIQWAIINGETVTGITAMLTDTGMDTGDMLLKKEIAISEDMTAGELHDKLSVLGAETLLETLQKLAGGTLERTPQNDAEATYACMLEKETGTIDWNKASKEIHNLVRGTNPWPGACTFYCGKRMRIWRTQLDETEFCPLYEKPGTVLHISKEGLLVATGDGMLKIKEIQFDSCKKMSMDECWHNLREGEVLG